MALAWRPAMSQEGRLAFCLSFQAKLGPRTALGLRWRAALDAQEIISGLHFKVATLEKRAEGLEDKLQASRQASACSIDGGAAASAWLAAAHTRAEACAGAWGGLAAQGEGLAKDQEVGQARSRARALSGTGWAPG
ncbi:unnamed protein product [Discosporangium mesarthrocarpum]